MKEYQVKDEDWLYAIVKVPEGNWEVFQTVIDRPFQPKYNIGVKGIFIEKKDADEYMEFLNNKTTN